jgi:hypothetical protein
MEAVGFIGTAGGGWARTRAAIATGEVGAARAAPVGRGSGDALGSALVERALLGPLLSGQDAEGAGVAANGGVQHGRQGAGLTLEWLDGVKRRAWTGRRQ